MLDLKQMLTPAMNKLLVVLPVLMILVACTLGEGVAFSPPPTPMLSTQITSVSIPSITPSFTPTATLGPTATRTPTPRPTPIPAWAPGWLIYENTTYGYSIAYPRTWRVEIDRWRAGETFFQSPETGSVVFLTVFSPLIREDDWDWTAWVRENWDRLVVFHNPGPPDPLINTQFLGRDAIFLFSTGRPTLGTQALMLFPEGERVFSLHLHAANWLEAEGQIYQTMLTSFTLNGASDSGYAVPAGSWTETYPPIETISGIVRAIFAEDRLMVLREPTYGFITMTLAPDGEMINAAGQAMVWDDILSGMHFEAYGSAGEGGTYLATTIRFEVGD